MWNLSSEGVNCMWLLRGTSFQERWWWSLGVRSPASWAADVPTCEHLCVLVVIYQPLWYIVGELPFALYSLRLILSHYFLTEIILGEFCLLHLRTLMDSEASTSFSCRQQILEGINLELFFFFGLFWSSKIKNYTINR